MMKESTQSMQQTAQAASHTAAQSVTQQAASHTEGQSVAQQTVQSLPQQTARMVSAFFDELIACGVQDVVVSPGSRSTALAMVAHASSMNLYVDVDERGAAFFALGLAKASGRAVAVVCTSGTALANYAPAVMEAESSRVPLVVLSGDRPARLQQLGAPQTFDQLKVFSDHVKKFWQMPQPSQDGRVVSYARQIAREAVIAAAPDTWSAGPVHINFPFDEPLKPDLTIGDLFVCGRGARAYGACALDCGINAQRESADLADLDPVVRTTCVLSEQQQCALVSFMREHRVIALCGEGALSPGINSETLNQQRDVLCQWAHAFDVPLLADPLSGMRSCGDSAVIDCYDNLFNQGDTPAFDAVIRFGRYPVSKSTTTTLAKRSSDHADAAQSASTFFSIVVDPQETRDFNCGTTTFIAMEPTHFVKSMLEGATCSACEGAQGAQDAQSVQGAADSRANDTTSTPNIAAWSAVNKRERERIAAVRNANDDAFEGSYVTALLDKLPEESLFFVANSMAIRAVDTFYNASDKALFVLGNRGLNGIDGTLSSALGAVQENGTGVLLTGDLTMLHDINALALQNEMRIRARDEYSGPRREIPSLTIVLLNNDGGAIFDMLPQQSTDPYFNRLFLTPQAVKFEHIAQAFDVPYAHAETVEQFNAALAEHLGKPGIHVIEITLPREGVRDRYQPYQR